MEFLDSENYVLTSSPYANDHRGVLQKVSLGGGKQLVIGGQQLGEWFGYSLSVEPGSDPRYAYVGAPNHRICASWVSNKKLALLFSFQFRSFTNTGYKVHYQKLL